MRAPFNKLCDVYAGPGLGGALKFANVPCRLVRRDESVGIPPSPPFYAWVTCPIADILTGSQLTDTGAFNLTLGDRLYNVATGEFMGAVLWAEQWLPAGPTTYQRVYVMVGDPLDDGEMALAFDMTDGPGGSPGEEALIELAFDGYDTGLSTVPTPGANCAGAGVINLGQTYAYSIAPGASDWFTWPTTASTQYTVYLLSADTVITSIVITSGTCGLPTPQFTIFAPSGNNNFTEGLFAGNGYIQVVTSLFGSAGIYSFKVTSP